MQLRRNTRLAQIFFLASVAIAVLFITRTWQQDETNGRFQQTVNAQATANAGARQGNRDLATQVAYWQSDAAVRQYAREHFDEGNPGDIIYAIVTPTPDVFQQNEGAASTPQAAP